MNITYVLAYTWTRNKERSRLVIHRKIRGELILYLGYNLGMTVINVLLRKVITYDHVP